MDYTFYFLNNNRVINEWRGCFENKEAAERFADGAAIGAMMTSGEIGVYGVSESNKEPITRQMTDKRTNVLFAYLEEKENNNN
jgi:hypothetical protein